MNSNAQSNTETKDEISSGLIKSCFIATGGDIDYDFTVDILNHKQFDFMIGADKGVEFFYKAQIKPNYIVGDFDSLPREIFDAFAGDPAITVRMFNPVKDATDTELAIKMALELGALDITIVGANGKRMDHMLANIQSLSIATAAGAQCVLADRYNQIRVIDSPCVITRDEIGKSYVSIFPLEGEIKDLTLEGFKYPLSHATLTSNNSLGVSNEITADFGKIIFHDALAVLIISRDHE